MEPYNTLVSFSSLESSSTSDSKSGGYPEMEVMLASQNPKKKAGRKKFKETRHPVYRGVRSRNSGSKWVCEVREPVTQTRVWLGTHPSAEMAARAHDVAVLAMRGPSACLNFADSVWRLPVPESNSIQDIQKAAAEAALAFTPSEMESEEREDVVAEYLDEEEMFQLPGFVERMAEALMVPPPQMGYGHFFDDVEFSDYTSLWSF